MKTKVVFLDLPYHCEYVVAIQELLPVGFVIEFENLSLRDKNNPTKVRTITGPYMIESTCIKYQEGLIQYLEMTPKKVG